MQTAHFWVTGLPGAGTSTFIHSVSQQAEDDQGRLVVEGVLDIRLHGLPLAAVQAGQGEAPLPLGIILMVDSSRPALFPEVPGILAMLEAAAPRAMPIIAYNKQDLAEAAPTLALRTHLPEDSPVQVFYCVASQKSAAENVLLALIYQILGR